MKQDVIFFGFLEETFISFQLSSVLLLRCWVEAFAKRVMASTCFIITDYDGLDRCIQNIKIFGCHTPTTGDEGEVHPIETWELIHTTKSNASIFLLYHVVGNYRRLTRWLVHSPFSLSAHQRDLWHYFTFGSLLYFLLFYCGCILSGAHFQSKSYLFCRLLLWQETLRSTIHSSSVQPHERQKWETNTTFGWIIFSYRI